MTPLKAIRAKCMECSNGQPNEVKLCPIPDCSLYGLRFGKPEKGWIYVERSKVTVKRDLSDEQRERMRQNWVKKNNKQKGGA